MQILTVSQMRDWEEALFARGISAETLMEQAGKGMAARLQKLFPDGPKTCVLVGKGNNGGDGLVAARELLEAGWPVHVHVVGPIAELGPLPAKHFKGLQGRHPSASITSEQADERLFRNCEIVLDAMLGVGNEGELRGEIARVTELLNRVRKKTNLLTFAVDCPTGLPALAASRDFTSREESRAVVADVTFAVGAAKDFLIHEELSHWAGFLEIISLQEKPPSGPGAHTLTPEEMAGWLPRRSAFSYKGKFGRVVAWGGSIGFTGAIAMTGEAALRVGAGLVFVQTHKDFYSVVAAQSRPEIMVGIDHPKKRPYWLEQASVLAIGPGLDSTSRYNRELLRFLIQKATVPLILDAGALVLLAEEPDLLLKAQVSVILTPNVGEMHRLLKADFNPSERVQVALAFCKKYPVILVLKGSRTLVVQKGKPLFYNTTGNASLAVGGSGDTLMGAVAGLIAQGLEPWDAARMGVWLHGHAGDLLWLQRRYQEGILPSEVGASLGAALRDLRGD